MAVRGEQLLLDSADRQDPAAQSDFAGHRHIAADRNFRERAGNRSGDGNSRRRAVLRDSAFGHMDVNIQVTVEILRQSQQRGARTDETHGRLGRFLHDVAQLAGGHQPSAAFHNGCLGSQDLPAHLGPGQPDGHAHFSLLAGLHVAEPDRAEELGNLGGAHNHLRQVDAFHRGGRFAGLTRILF